MKRLVVRHTPPRSAPSGEEVVVVLGDVSAPAGAPWRTAEDYVDLRARDAIDEAGIGWTKQWGRCPLVDGRSFRELFVWKGVSLWWFAELFLHHCTESPRYVRLIETLHRILDAEHPQEVEEAGLLPAEATLLARTCAARGVLFHGSGAAPPRTSRVAVTRASVASRLNTWKAWGTALKAALAGRSSAGPEDDPRGAALFLSHAAFWRERREAQTGEPIAYEHYFDRLIPLVARDALLRPFVVAVGPATAFRRRGAAARARDWVRLPARRGPYVHVNRYLRLPVVREVARGARDVRRTWQVVRRSPALVEAFSHRGVVFADLAAADLAGTVLLQLPWAIRCYEEMAEALRVVRPRVVCLYAESSGWGRAALAACRAAGVPTVAVQHGILYPKYYSYRHDPDEADCPRPDFTAVFGESARRLLLSLGSYAPGALVATGSPKFDELIERASSVDRKGLRAGLGTSEGDRLLAVASRFRAIRRTHQAIGSAFPALVRAVESLPNVRAVVKPHPAETPDAYQAVLREHASRRVTILPPSADLFDVLHACDALVTVESLSAVEALVLGRPVVVLNMPTHLRELVDQGVAVGVAVGEDPARALRGVLDDPEVRDRLSRARARYLSDFAMGVDGRATERIAALLRRAAALPQEAAGAAGMVG